MFVVFVMMVMKRVRVERIVQSPLGRTVNIFYHRVISINNKNNNYYYYYYYYYY